MRIESASFVAMSGTFAHAVENVVSGILHRLIGLFVIALFASGCASQRPVSPFSKSTTGPVLLAHRGVSQNFDHSGLGDGNTTCTATRIYPPKHSFLENTLDSMSASIAAGAQVIEIDVHPTTDGHFAVFHDWTLECRTNGSGRTRDHTLAYLKQLDIGYGYSADGGKSFPFRGKGVGLMPSLDDVLNAFPNQLFLINVKSNYSDEGERLADYLNNLSDERRRQIAVYGGEKPVAVIRSRTTDILTMSRRSMKACLAGYEIFGWSGVLPESCERSLVLVPINYTKWLWSWPKGFIERMRSVGSAVFVLGTYSGDSVVGIDSLDDLKELPPDYDGGVWTNEIELIGAAMNLGHADSLINEAK